MQRPTPLKTAIFMSGRKQRDIAAELGIDETVFSRIVNGLHCNDDLRQKIAQALHRTVDELWPAQAEAA